MTTTPTTDTRPIAGAAREADIDLRNLQAHRPPYSIPPTIRAASPEIDAAAARYIDIVRQRGEAARASTAALNAVMQVRAEHSAAVTQAALDGKPEPKPVDVSEHFEEAREQYRRAIALSRAVATAGNALIRDLEGARDLLADLRQQEKAAAQEALDRYREVDAILAEFAEQRSEADWLENVILRGEHGRSTTYSDRPKPVPSTIQEAQIAVKEASL
jgi:hypothetical protein